MITSKGEYTNYARLAILWFGHATPGLFDFQKSQRKRVVLEVKMSITHQNKICHPLDKCDDSMMIKRQSDLLATFPKRLIKMESKKGSKMG